MTTKNELFSVVEIPIYGGKVLICVAADPWTALRDAKLPRGGYLKRESTTVEAWVEELTKLKKAPSGEDVRWIIALRPTASLNTVAHECYHLTNFIAAWYGINPVAGDDEAPAYVHGWLVEHVWTTLCAFLADVERTADAEAVAASDSSDD